MNTSHNCKTQYVLKVFKKFWGSATLTKILIKKKKNDLIDLNRDLIDSFDHADNIDTNNAINRKTTGLVF